LPPYDFRLVPKFHLGTQWSRNSVSRGYTRNRVSFDTVFPKQSLGTSSREVAAKGSLIHPEEFRYFVVGGEPYVRPFHSVVQGASIYFPFERIQGSPLQRYHKSLKNPVSCKTKTISSVLVQSSTIEPEHLDMLLVPVLIQSLCINSGCKIKIISS